MKFKKISTSFMTAALIVGSQFFPAFQTDARAEFTNFVTASGGKLYDGSQELRWCSVDIPFVDFTEDGPGNSWVQLSQWEQEDLLKTVVQMGGKVIRRYALSTKQPGKAYDAMVQGPNKFSETAFVAFDRFLALCNKYNVRIIVPFVDQYNYNWVGGIASYESFRGVAVDDGYNFMTNSLIRKDFKATINYVLNRVNTITGVKYKDDKAILAWETGNELWSENKNYSWVTDIAAYVKSIDSNHLLIDGDMEPTLSKSGANTVPAGMTCPNIDIVSNHYYKWSNGVTDMAAAFKTDMKIAKGKKPFIVGEYGITNATDIHKLLDTAATNGVSGIMLWSLRGHRESGGFWQHTEGSSWHGTDTVDYWAYHWPGFSPINDNYGETTVIQDVYQHAFSIDGNVAPAIPIPSAPVLLSITDPKTSVNWKGCVGANVYDVERSKDNINWKIVGSNVTDMYKNYSYPPVFKDDSTNIADTGYYYRVIAKNSSGNSDPSNTIIWGNPGIFVLLSDANPPDTFRATVQKGFTRQMIAVELPSADTIHNAVWNSTNNTIAEVNGSGLLTGISLGSDTIIVTTQDGIKKCICIISVVSIPVQNVNITRDSTTILIDSAFQLNANISPSNASIKDIIWSSGNNSIATISVSGMVTGVAEGRATITATTLDGGKTDTSIIIVTSSLTYYIIENRWQTTTCLKDDGTGKLTYGTNPDNDYTYQWSQEPIDEFVRLKNRSTGNYMNIQNDQDWVECSSVQPTLQSAEWSITSSGDGWNYIDSRTVPGDMIQIENLLDYAQFKDGDTKWWSAMWQFHAVKIITGFENAEQDKVTIFPNPATDNLNITFVKTDKYDIAIYDATGREISKLKLTGNRANINVSGFKDGVYVIQVTGADKTFLTKFIKR